jgi:hypothetical protein
MSQFRLTIEDGQFRDRQGRTVVLRGINVAGDAKLPSEPNQPSHVKENFFDGDNVKFHARPFPVADAHTHFSRLRRWGYNTIRYVFTWEAIEAAGPGRYDEEFISHTIEVLRIAKGYGFYVIMDPHQDVVSNSCRPPAARDVPFTNVTTVVQILRWLRRSNVDHICLRS